MEVAKLFMKPVIKKITIVHNERVFVIEGVLMIYVWRSEERRVGKECL